MKEDDESREIAEAQQEREEQAQTDGAEELEDDEEDGRIETAEELAKKKTENKFKASGNLGNIQIFMQNANFRDGTGLKQILDLAYRDVGADPKYDLEKEDDCAAFFRNCKNKDYVALAIVLSVFEMVSVGDLANLKDTLMECLPPVFRLDQEGKVISAPESNPYLSLNDVLPVIQGKIFVTEEGRQCIGYGREPSKVLKNMWIQFPALRKPIIIWLLKVNDTFEYRTTFEAYQIVTAFARVVSEDFPYAKKEVFERLYSNPRNLGLLARLAHELLKKGKNRNGSEEMVLKWAESDSEWLWKAALLVYLYADAPFPGEKLEKALALTVKKKFLRLHRGDLRFIAVYAGHFKNMRSFMTGVFRELGASQEKDYLPYLAVIYLYLTKYGYFMIDKKMTNLPFVVHDSQKQAVAMSPVLAYIMARYDLRRQLYSVLRAYLEEIADYDVPQSMIKHISAYFYILAQSDSGYRTDILMFLRESGGSVAKSVCHMLTEIYRNKGKWHMNKFYNKLILADEVYPNDWFPQIPNYRKQGSAFILVEGKNDNILVDGNTTTKEIRQGKYKRLIEISTVPYMEEIRFESASKETTFTFDVYVKAVIQVRNPITFYNNRNLDVTSYFTNMFLLDVRKITRKYSVLNYDGMDEVLTKKLSSYNNVDVSTGFEYRISVVDAKPGGKAIEYVRRSNEQSLNAELRNRAGKLIGDVTLDYENAVRMQVVEGKISEEEAILKIWEFKQASYKDRMKQITELRGNSLITDTEARGMIKKLMLPQETEKLTGEVQQDEWTDSDLENDRVLDELYEEG